MTNKNYTEFSFEEFLQDDYFISSIRKPTPESSKFWDQYCKKNINLQNFDAAKIYIESINKYHSTLSFQEINEIRREINKKKDRKKHNLRLYYISACAAAGIALLIFFKFQGTTDLTPASSKQDIVSFADMSRPDIMVNDIQLVLSDEQTILFDQKETVITYDSTGIIVDKESVAKNGSGGSGFNQLIVPLGKRSVLNLSDGTKVWVNSDSRLIYPVSFAKDIREIYVDGEIFIEVAEEIRRPFVIQTKDMNIQVLGTKFNVTAYEADNEKKVVLVSGSVQVTSKKDEKITRLLPEQMYWSEDGQSHVEKVDTRKYISWIDGVHYCENENLESILLRLSRFYGVEIICDPSIAKVVFSGKLDLKENMSDIFEGISFTLPISFTENNGKYNIFQIK